MVGAAKEMQVESASRLKPGHRRRMISIVGMLVCGVGFLVFAAAYFWPERGVEVSVATAPSKMATAAQIANEAISHQNEAERPHIGLEFVIDGVHGDNLDFHLVAKNIGENSLDIVRLSMIGPSVIREELQNPNIRTVPRGGRINIPALVSGQLRTNYPKVPIL